MHSLSQGFQFGALVGAMIGLGLGMIMYATSNFMDFTGQLTDGIWSILYYGLTGMAISWVYKVTTKE
jgi:membrane-associated PAP2 superfamily phosphatase